MAGAPPRLFGSFMCGNGLLPLWFGTAAASFIQELMTDADWVIGNRTHQTAGSCDVSNHKQEATRPLRWETKKKLMGRDTSRCESRVCRGLMGVTDRCERRSSSGVGSVLGLSRAKRNGHGGRGRAPGGARAWERRG